MLGVHVLQQLGRSRNVLYTNYLFTGRVKLIKELSYNISPCYTKANDVCHTNIQTQHTRWASTSTSSSNRSVSFVKSTAQHKVATAIGAKDEQGGVVAVYRKTRFAVELLWNGCKNLYYDVKLAACTRRKLGIVIHGDYSKLTRDEILHFHQVC